MVLKVTVLPEQWAIVREVERASFNVFLQGVIACHITKFEDIEKTIVILPSTTTKIQRYNIHRLTTEYLISESYDTPEGDRVMRVSIHKSYLEDLFHDYPFSNHVKIQIDPVAKTEKQKLFDAMLGFINENLQTEFDAYMNTF